VAKYLIRAIKQVAVYELTGKERIVDAADEAQLNRLARQFMADEFPGEFGAQPDIEIEIKKQGEDTPVTEQPLPEGFAPKNRAKHNPGAPF
jgi:hypothetical protein